MEEEKKEESDEGIEETYGEESESIVEVPI